MEREVAAFQPAAAGFAAVGASSGQGQLFTAGPDDAAGPAGIEAGIDTRKISVFFGGELGP
jgi:hypothetical protein